MRWFSDGSRRENRAASGIYCENNGYRKNERISDHCTVMQGELFAIAMCARWCTRNSINNQEIFIHSDSQAALMALRNKVIRSETVKKCSEELNKLSSRNKVELSWVPGHSNIEGNEIADRQANEGIEKNGVEIPLKTPSCEINNLIIKKERKEFIKLWNMEKAQRSAKLMMKEPNIKRAKILLEMERKNLRIAIGILTGMCCFKSHLYKINKSENNRCRFCDDKEETMIHILCECYRLEVTRLEQTGKARWEESNIHDADLEDLIRFLKKNRMSQTFFRTETAELEG